MKDTYLIPFILPLVFSIATSLPKDGFQPVLIKLQPLFEIKDPPQIMMSGCRGAVGAAQALMPFS